MPKPSRVAAAAKPALSLRRQPVKMNAFTKKVIALIKSIPRGNVATYGQIARLAGKPHGSRGVGWILHSCAKSHRLPWQRVINSQGKISFPKKNDLFEQQRSMLLRERVAVSEAGSISLTAYGWKKKPRKEPVSKTTPQMFRD